MSEYEFKFFDMPLENYIGEREREREMESIRKNYITFNNPEAYFEGILNEIYNQINKFGYNNRMRPDCLYVDCETYVKLKYCEREYIGVGKFSTHAILGLEIKLIPVCTDFIKVGYKDMDEMSWLMIKNLLIKSKE